MKIGIVSLFDGQPGAKLQDCARTASELEDMGFSSFWLPDHIVCFEEYAPNYSYSDNNLPPFAQRQGFFDPLIGLAAAASATSKIRLGTNVLLLPQRNPVVLAKEVGALDHLCQGRFDFGVGIGWSPEEYAALGVPFARRGARADDYLAAITSLWQDDLSTHVGEFVSFANVVALPKPVQKPRPPILVGGQTRGALRRAARHGDGWISWQLPADQIPAAHDRLNAECEAIGRDPAQVRRIHSAIYSTPQAFHAYAETAQRHGASETVWLPWVPDRASHDVIAEIADLAGRT